MGSTADVDIISGAGSGAEVRSRFEARLLEGLDSGPGLVLVEILVVRVAVGSELGDVGFESTASSGSGLGQGFGSRQGAMTGSLSETGLG